MTRGIARGVAIAALVFSIGSLIAALTASVTAGDRVEPGTIVVVGDPTIPGMQPVLTELRDAAARGDDLRQSLVQNASWVIVAVFVLLWLGVGAMIVWRQPGHWAGWLFLIIGSTFPLVLVSGVVVVLDLKGNVTIPLSGLFAWLGEFAFYTLGLVPLLFLLYPDGHPPGRRWRWAVGALLGGTFVAFLGFLLRPGPYNNWRADGIVYANPLGIRGFSWAGAVIGAGTVVTVVAGLSTAVAVVMRFRRSTGEERQQMRVIAFVAALAGVQILAALLLTLLGGVLGLHQDTGPPIFLILWIGAVLTIFVGLPLSHLVAILRYRLWELDVVIKKTVIAIVLTLMFCGVGLFLLFAVGQYAFWTSRELAFAAGAVGGALIVPLLRLSRRIAGRIAFGRRASTYEVLTAFSERVGETYSTPDVLPRMVHVLASGTGAASARVLLHVGAEVREMARWPAEQVIDGEEHVTPVTDRGEQLGALAVSMPANDPMNPRKEQLVRDLATQAGLVLRNVRLIEELRASRQRLVAAQDEERRKIERNIHDGVQQQLVALAVQLRIADGMVGKDPEREHELLTALQAATTEALEDLRDLARGIYPPLLADRGLAAALDAQARRAAVPTTVESHAVDRYAPDIEAAVYFCALEALNNIAKYAGATRAWIRMSATDGHLELEVADDGRGFDLDATGNGTGLQGMADRLEAIGGSLSVRSTPGAGTTVTGSILAHAVEVTG